MSSTGIYLHVPFCKTKCIYCDFYSVPGWEDSIPRFVNAIITEIESCPVDLSDGVIDTVYIGGGTPGLLEPIHLKRILSTLNKRYDLRNTLEITIEANPGEAPQNKLQEFRSLGINRLSLGVQSLEPALLSFLTRIHTSRDVFTTFAAARKAGFTNINCDLIFNIPGQTAAIWKRDLRRIIDLAPEHISAYSLTVEKNTRLYNLVQNGKVPMPSEAVSSNQYQGTQDVLNANGYIQYEISNFARPGKECRHNLHYWWIDPYLGFGPSAHSYDGIHRWQNIPSLEQYLVKIETGQTPIVERYELSELSRTNELIGFGIRMPRGIHLDQIPITYRKKVEKIIRHNLSKWNGYLELKNNCVSLTKKGLAFADAIAVDLMLEN